MTAPDKGRTTEETEWVHCGCGCGGYERPIRRESVESEEAR